LGLLLASISPQVEDPLPDRIGLGLPFATAGAGGVLAGIARAGASPARRDQAINRGGLIGFVGGVILYLVALIIQVGFGS
jgi:hypothetical protein